MRNAPHRAQLLRQILSNVDGSASYDWLAEPETGAIFTLLSAEEREQWNDGGGQVVEASVRIPNGFAPITTDRVRIVSPAAHSGDWAVVTVRHQADHARLMLRRVTG